MEVERFGLRVAGEGTRCAFCRMSLALRQAQGEAYGALPTRNLILSLSKDEAAIANA